MLRSVCSLRTQKQDVDSLCELNVFLAEQQACVMSFKISTLDIPLCSDPNIRVACLTCLGSIVAAQAPSLEVNYILQPSRPPVGLSESSQSHTPQTSGADDGLLETATVSAESGYGSNEGNTASATSTPTKLPSGCQTPNLNLSDLVMYSKGGEISWVIKLCMRTIAPHLLESVGAAPEERVRRTVAEVVQPLPVRLEALQLLAQLAKSYFIFIRCVMAMLLVKAKMLSKPYLFSHTSVKLMTQSSAFLSRYMLTSDCVMRLTERCVICLIN